MKIGIDISQVVYAGTGVGTYTAFLVNELVKLKTKDSFQLFGSSLRSFGKLTRFTSDFSQPSVSKYLFHIPPTVLNILWNQLHVFSVENFTGSVDIFHSSDWIQPPVRARKITTIHDLITFRYPEHFPKVIVETQKQRLSWVAKECDFVIADSQSTKEDIISYLSFDERKIRVVPLGVSPEFTLQTKETIDAVKKKYRIEGDYILSVGTNEPRKNLTKTIEAFKQLRKDISCTLVLAGKYGWGENIDDENGVRLLGYVDPSDLPALYNGARCFVYPSLYEGFGLPVLEAMRSGCLVICSDRGSLKEITGNYAFLVDPEDSKDIAAKIEQILNLSKKEREEKITKGITHAKGFTWQKTAEQTHGIYKEVVDTI